MAITDPSLAPAQHQPKSDAAHAAALATFMDMQQNPVGTASGDERFLGMPSNYKIPNARIYVINHSRTRAWRRTIVPVSYRRGAEDAILADKSLKAVMTTELIYKQVEQGRDMNRYKEEIYPVAIKLRVPGAPDQRGGSAQSYDRIIPPADLADSKPLAIEVPEGTWDLYLGNYERMRSSDPTIVNGEIARLGNYWSRRHNPVFRYTDDGVVQDYMIGGKVNPFGYLEFVRVPVRAVVEPIDKEYLTSLDVIEAS